MHLIDEAMDRVAVEDSSPDTDPLILAGTLGSTQSIFEFVRDQIANAWYAGLLQGPKGTLCSQSGNDVDQSNLLVTMLRSIGKECRFAKARRVLVTGETAEHIWVQVKDGDTWMDLDPNPDRLAPEIGRSPRPVPFDDIPRNLRHFVRLDIKYRLEISGRSNVRSGLTAELDVADLYARELTLAHRWDGTWIDDRYVVNALQPVLKLDDSLFCGTIVSSDTDGKPATPAGRLGGIFDQVETRPAEADGEQEQGLEILSHWIDVFITSPGKPVDRFTYTLSNRSNNPDSEYSSLDALMSIQAFGFTPAEITDQTLSEYVRGAQANVRGLSSMLSRIHDVTFTPTGPAELFGQEESELATASLENGQRSLASTVLNYYMHLSDNALNTMNEEFGTNARHVLPRAIITSVCQSNGNVRYDVDLRRNRVYFNNSSDLDPELIKLASYHRGLYESRLEGAVLKAFTGQAGITTADVMEAAAEQQIRIVGLARHNRKDVHSLELSGDRKSLINASINKGRTILIPEKPVSVEGEELLAWFEYDPETGFIEGVFSSGKYQGMTEYVSEEAIVQTLVSQGMSYLSSSLVGYYFSIATGLGHFYACLLDLDNPNKACFGQPDVCLPAHADAVALCKAWKDAKQYFDFGTAAMKTDIAGLIPWPDAWEAMAGGPCELGASAGLKWFGCSN